MHLVTGPDPPLDHMVASWTAAELDEQIGQMLSFHQSGSAYGHESVLKDSLSKLKVLKEDSL